jgi:outer membrane protein assembly factor BamB
LPGAGEWTHQYGRADNSAFGGETLSGATKSTDFEVQWIGRPGPRFQPDRNGRKPSPLSTGGRLFVQGLQRIAALDAYNGVPLWTVEIPDLHRFNLPRDCSNWCADEANLYAAIRNKGWRIDAAGGAVSRLYDVLPGPKKEWRYDWGYIASDGKRLIGSAVKADTAWTNFWGGGSAGWYDAKDGPVTAKVCSENLFALDKHSGKTIWTYNRGVIANSTITIGDGRVYFIESRNAKVMADESRRVGLTEF